MVKDRQREQGGVEAKAEGGSGVAQWGQPQSPLLTAGLTAAQYGKTLMPRGTPVHLNARLPLSGAQVVQKNCLGLILEAGECAPPGSVLHTASSEVALAKCGGVWVLL